MLGQSPEEVTVCCGTDHIEHGLVFTNGFEVHVLNSVDTAQNKTGHAEFTLL